jgi:hypothetical protein
MAAEQEAGSSLHAVAFVDSVAGRATASAAVAAKQLEHGEHVRRLQAALAAQQSQRWRFWRSLLVAAGLEPCLQPLEE